MAQYSVLHLDDDALMLMKAKTCLTNASFGIDFSLTSVDSVDGFWKSYQQLQPQCILLDLNLGGAKSEEGLDVLQTLRTQGFSGPVIVFSSSASTKTIGAVMAAGATDFVTKSLEESELGFRVAQAIRNAENAKTKSVSLTATGATMREIESKIPRLLSSGIRSVLVLGPTGTGKEVVADLFKTTIAGRQPFIVVNSASISKDLIESELFGYEKGAFTGAQNAKMGLIPAADGGWIFLDEVARLSMGAQAALLRAIENGEVRPVGGTQTRRVKIRVLAATNEDLEDMVKRGEFRSDLLQRLRSYEILLPALVERSVEEREEILNALVTRLNVERKTQAVTYSLAPTVKTLFLAASWKQGNVREMWQTLQAAAVDSESGVITPGSLPKSFIRQSQQEAASGPAAAPEFPVDLPRLEDELLAKLLTKLIIEKPDVLHSFQKIATNLGTSRQGLVQRAKRLAAAGLLPESLKTLIDG